MNNQYLSIYNNLIKLTRNKYLYLNLDSKETFSDRILFMLLHLAFLFKAYKRKNSRETMQEIHDFIFKQIEISIREIGHGDVSINKNMKMYINYFFDILINVDKWDSLNEVEKSVILQKFISKPKNISFFVDYFEKLSIFYQNNSLNYFTKDIEEFKI